MEIIPSFKLILILCELIQYLTSYCSFCETRLVQIAWVQALHLVRRLLILLSTCIVITFKCSTGCMVTIHVPAQEFHEVCPIMQLFNYLASRPPLSKYFSWIYATFIIILFNWGTWMFCHRWLVNQSAATFSLHLLGNPAWDTDMKITDTWCVISNTFNFCRKCRSCTHAHTHTHIKLH